MDTTPLLVGICSASILVLSASLMLMCQLYNKCGAATDPSLCNIMHWKTAVAPCLKFLFMYHNKMLMTEVSSTKLQVVSYALLELAFLLPRAS